MKDISVYRDFLKDLIRELLQDSRGGVAAEHMDALVAQEQLIVENYSKKNKQKHEKEKHEKHEKENHEKDGKK